MLDRIAPKASRTGSPRTTGATGHQQFATQCPLRFARAGIFCAWWHARQGRAPTPASAPKNSNGASAPPTLQHGRRSRTAFFRGTASKKTFFSPCHPLAKVVRLRRGKCTYTAKAHNRAYYWPESHPRRGPQHSHHRRGRTEIKQFVQNAGQNKKQKHHHQGGAARGYPPFFCFFCFSNALYSFLFFLND